MHEIAYYLGILMIMLYYVTSNKAKVRSAQKYLSPYDVKITDKHVDLEEIQSDDIELIALHKAQQAFAAVGKPLIINDSGWYIPALNGFPGPFMKYVNHWLTAADVLRLMDGQQNREIILREVVTYIDSNLVKTFHSEVKGVILKEDTAPEEDFSRSLISLSRTGKSIAECWQTDTPSADDYNLWQNFAEWYGKHA